MYVYMYTHSSQHRSLPKFVNKKKKSWMKHNRLKIKKKTKRIPPEWAACLLKHILIFHQFSYWNTTRQLSQQDPVPSATYASMQDIF